MFKLPFSKNWPHVLSEPHVRDLAWILFSPSLLDTKSSLDVMVDSFFGLEKSQIEIFISKLQKLDKNPEPLLNILKNAPFKRLGDYFEELIWYWLGNTPNCHKLERNIVIKNKRTTLSELDFIFFSENLGCTVHWEVSVKFFLLNGPKDDFASYIGINPEDTLEKKVLILKRQALLLKSPEAKRFLEHELLLPLESQCLIKGYLFYPLKSDGSFKKEEVEGIHPDHLCGWWDRIKNKSWKIKLQTTDNNHRFKLLPKLQWLAPSLDDGHNLLSAKELIEIVEQENDKPHMVAMLLLENDMWQECRWQECRWQECERAVLVPGQS